MKEKSKNKNRQKLFNLPIYQAEYIKKEANKKGITQSEVIRRVLEKEMESKNV